MQFRPGGDSDAVKAQRAEQMGVECERSEEEDPCNIHPAERVTTWHTRTSRNPTSATKILEPLQTR